jgi:hypothetical protein
MNWLPSKTRSLIRVRKPYFRRCGHFPGYDFTKEVIPPGANAKYPNGVVGLRVDDDFWAVAAVPYSFRYLPTGTLVRKLWPQMRNVRNLLWPKYTREASIAWKCEFSWASNWAQNKDFLLPLPDRKRETIMAAMRRQRAIDFVRKGYISSVAEYYPPHLNRQPSEE